MAIASLGTLGAVLSPAQPGVLDEAAELEQLGFDTIWLTGGPMTSLAQIGQVLDATSAVTVATGIIPVVTFAAADVTRTYAEMEEAHPGRFVVGLGGAHVADPLATLEAYLDQLDGIPKDRRLLAALGPRMLRLAAERTGGALPVLVTPAYVAEARAVLGEGPTLAIEQLLVLSSDPTEARTAARGPLGYLGQVSTYQASFRRQGLGDQLTDQLVDALIPWGDEATLVAHLEAVRAAGADHVAISVVSPQDPPPMDDWRRLAGALTSR